MHPIRLNAMAAILAGLFTPMLAQATTEGIPISDVVVISGSRSEHSSFDLPAAVDVLDAQRIRDGQVRVNASEALAAVPGVVVQNRQNYAQDLQISSRGFGARSAFGVRGVRLVTDGIPASMPDGQGQAATFNLDMADRIEVLRGPYSAIYGNHAGGVIQLFTRDGEGAPTVEASFAAGSDGLRKTDMNAQGSAAGISFVLDASRFDTDGYRDHSAARRDQAMAKLTMQPLPGARLVLVANGLRQKDTQDPLGVTWSTWQRDPRAGEIDANDTQVPKRTLAERYNTRKSIDHQQGGASWDQRFESGRLHVSVWGGNRQVTQFQAFSKAFQAPASHSGGVVDFDRNFYGADINWQDMREIADGRLTTTVGVEYGRSSDDRKGYENFIGTTFGVQGKLRRDEQDVVSSTDPYLQTEWQGERWQFTAGIRHSQMRVSVDDRFLSNGNDSGDLRYSRSTPLLGVLYKLTPEVNLYATAARGFEAPTLNELFYSGTGAGFNFQLRPARSTHVETGIKARAGDTHVNAALFQVRTRDELVVDASSGGRTSYRNASETLRQGAELSLDSKLGTGFSARVAATLLKATYEKAFGNVREGARLPGVPRASLFAELAWKSSGERFTAALESLTAGRVYAEDANADVPAPGYSILNVRLVAKQSWAGWRFSEFGRLNNLADRHYIGSVIVGDSNKRYYEAAPGRNWVAGASAQYQF
ncbi:TonB-dependent receptor [Pseudoduganella eburnea]|uniref:TonB-dependent receptor n=1 Tax=Massilia eburnea TaxID=1776165 RepID=A0A6L6QPY8_9BURK|nr:TonB-dependent receptor [Massilia eburnea]MTW14419.1 TonB-dependent receptor [Massilia eburnea]